jgi:hypothetical protein
MDSALIEELGFQIPVGARDFSSLQNVQTGCGAHPSSYSVGAGPRPEVSHTPASSAGVKNEWSYTSAPPICIHGADRNFTFFFNSSPWRNSDCPYAKFYFSSKTAQ